MLTLKKNGTVLINGKEVGRWLNIGRYVFQAEDGFEIAEYRLSTFRSEIAAAYKED